MIGIIDYGAGNLRSVINTLKYLGAESVVSGNPDELNGCDKLILPGVGAFPAAMEELRKRGLDSFITDAAAHGKPLLGICLGAQLLFEYGTEVRKERGLGLIPGQVRLIETPFRLPHIGWNELRVLHDSPLLDGVPKEGAYVYFVHSYLCECASAENLIAYADYGDRVAAVVQSGNVFGCQFHPEKSSTIGLRIIENYVNFSGN
ncbi:MAG: imidazole glycerol phosphate synthase subunit HisH [Oscillospiraceae bacterium]|jgi:glutamine amidotransferase|nr:imidazole glycerol phosphate synthase subunit HisH [Oscillospiraceae bacterium]